MCVSADSCDDVHVTDVTIDVGDDVVSVKSGLHWKTKKKVAAQNYLFERVSILHRNFAIGSAVSGDVLNITLKDSVIGNTPPSGSCTLDPCPGSGSIGSPWDLPMNVPQTRGSGSGCRAQVQHRLLQDRIDEVYISDHRRPNSGY